MSQKYGSQAVKRKKKIDHRGRLPNLFKHDKEHLYLLIAFMKDSQHMTFEQISHEFKVARHPITRQRAHKLYKEAKDYYRTDPELYDSLRLEQA